MAAKHQHKRAMGQRRNRIGVPYSSSRRDTEEANGKRSMKGLGYAKARRNGGLKLSAELSGPSSPIASVDAALMPDGSVRKRNRRQIVVAVLTLILGALCIAYPFVSDAIHQARERDVVRTTIQSVYDTDEDTLAAERGEYPLSRPRK